MKENTKKEEKKEEKNFHSFPAMIVSVLVPMAFMGFLYFTLGIGVDVSDAPNSLLFCLVKNTDVRKWMLLFLFIFSQAAIVYCIMRQRRIRAFLVPLAELALLFAYLKMSANISAFVVSVLLVSAAYACLISEREEAGASVCFFFLQLLAYHLHPQAMLYLQPAGALTLLGISHAEKERMHIGILKIVFSILLVLALGTGIRFLTNKITKTEAPAQKVTVSAGTQAGGGDSVEADIAAASGQNSVKKAKKDGPFKIAKRVYEQSLLRHEIMPVLVLLLIALGMMFVLMKFRYLSVFIGLVLGHLISWGILLSNGTIDDEFAVSFLFAEALLLFMIILSMLDVDKVFQKKKWVKQALAIIGLSFFFLFAFFTARRAWKAVENGRLNCTNSAECDKVVMYGDLQGRVNK